MEGDGPLVVREKFHAAVAMSIDQALFEMEMVGHDFFLFTDAASGLPSVVYRRRGYQYGVIRLVDGARAGVAATSQRAANVSRQRRAVRRAGRRQRQGCPPRARRRLPSQPAATPARRTGRLTSPQDRPGARQRTGAEGQPSSRLTC